ncbi:MAG: hypothetical protein ACWA6X_12450 [Bauldia sp.]
MASLGFLLSAGIVAAETLDGRWTLVPGACDGVTDNVLTIDTAAGTLRYWESVCTITSLTPIGTFEMAWRLNASCSGEGDTWVREAIFGVSPPFDVGALAQLVEIDTVDGFVITRTYCGAVPGARTK